MTISQDLLRNYHDVASTALHAQLKKATPGSDQANQLTAQLCQLHMNEVVGLAILDFCDKISAQPHAGTISPSNLMRIQ